MANPFNLTEPQIQARMIAQTPHLTHIEARVLMLKEHVAAQHTAEPRTITAFDFFARIPDAVKAKISAASAPGEPFAAALQWGIPQLSAAQIVYADNEQLVGLLTQLVTAGILTAEEKTHILDF